MVWAFMSLEYLAQGRTVCDSRTRATASECRLPRCLHRGRPFWSQIHDPIGALDDVGVVLDHQCGIATIHERLSILQQDADVLEVKARGRFVQRRASGRSPPSELRRELDALRFAARKRGGRLTEVNIAEADPESVSSFRGGEQRRKSFASSTVMSSTSAIERPR